MKKMLLAVFFITLGIVFTSNAYSQGVRVKASNNYELQQALNDPNVGFIEITQDGYYEALSDNAYAGNFVAKETGRGPGDCTKSITTSNVCFVSDPTYNTATAGTNGDPSCPDQPDATTPAPGDPNGWTATTITGGTIDFEIGPGYMADIYDYVAHFKVSAAGKYQINYRWDEYNSFTADVFFWDSPTVTLDVVENCGDATVTYTMDPGTPTGSGTTSEEWELATGTGAFIAMATPTFVANEFVFDPADYYPVTATALCGAFTLQVTATNPGSTGSDGCPTTVSNTFYIKDDPYDLAIATVADDCFDATVTSTLEGTYSGGGCYDGTAPTEIWTVSGVTGTFYPANVAGNGVGANVGFVPDGCGEATFTYTVSNGDCVSYTTTTAYYYDAPIPSVTGDQSVCGLNVILTGADAGSSCFNQVTPTVAWTKVSGTGTVTWDPSTQDADVADITVSQCGDFVFKYEVTNGDCVSYTTYAVTFTDYATFPTYTPPTEVCGDVSEEFVLAYNVSCSDDPSGVWSYDQTGATVVTGTTTDSWEIDRTGDCGTYGFTYTVTNGLCVSYTTFDVDFYDAPELTVSGKDDPFTCSTVEYTVANAACEFPGQVVSYEWNVDGGSFTTTTGTTLSVTWDYATGAGTVAVTGTILGDVEMCTGTDDLTVDKKLPTLEGQIRYWNSDETFMPTPFPTNINGSFPEDYFYVELWGSQTTGKTSDVQLGTTQRVEPKLLIGPTGQDSTLMSYFGFTLPTNTQEVCASYKLKVYDGGLTYSTNQPVDNTYLGASYTYTNWGGVNATDALAIQLMAAGSDLNSAYPWVGLFADVPAYGFYSNDIADVNTSGTTITALDALTATYRAVGLLGSYPNSGANLFSPNFTVAGRMVSELPETTWDTYFDCNVAKAIAACNDIQFTHSGEDYQYFDLAVDHKYTSAYLPDVFDSSYINLYYEAEGDINASYVPTSGGFKAESAIDLVYENEVSTRVDQIITIPISINRDADLNAISLFMTFRNDLIEVLGTNFGEDFVNIDNEEGILNIGWFSMETKDVVADEAIAQIKVRVLADIPLDTELFELVTNTELADADAIAISDVTLKTIGVTTDKLQFNESELVSSNYPNPFANTTTIAYTLPESGTVKIDVRNSMGVLVATIMEEVQEAGVHNLVYNTDIRPGIYFYSITLQGETNKYSTVERMIVVN